MFAQKLLHCVGLTALILTTSCATRPESIPVSYVAFEKYTDGSCTQLTTQMEDARTQLAKVSKQQDAKANGDAFGVFLLLIPISKLTGDHAAEVAKWKGEIEAIETAQIKKKCK